MKELSLHNCRIDGRYDIQSTLGRGSYAEIYLARDTMASPQSPHSSVVIKALNVFLQDDLDSDLEQTLVENFQNEAIALDRVRHPNIISRLGHGTARDLLGTVFHYLILEYLSSGDLAKLRSQQGLSVPQAFSYLEQISAGLAHAHKCGVIHRDIKPQNILLDESRKIVKIADFGVARLSQNNSPITRVGTNMYAPPEHSPVFADSTNVMVVSELTPAADIYSLAKSAYVLVTGESPRRFTNSPISELPSAFGDKNWGGEFLRVLRQATQNKPDERYQTVGEFWRALALVRVSLDNEVPEALTQISARPQFLPQASKVSGFSRQAPLLPTFRTSKDFKLPISEEKTPHFVVKLQGDQIASNLDQKSILNEKNQLQFEIPQPPPKRNNRFLKRSAIFLLLLTLFGSALFSTQYYLRNGRIFPKIVIPSRKPEGIATTNVNIRIVGDVDSQIIGLVPRGSRVRILNTKDNWLEIDIIELSRPKDAPTDAEHGWVSRKYIDVQE